ncbi:hypothetical protein ACTHGU_10480 [Chitinophagaceae bacterium MMS25-I14]
MRNKSVNQKEKLMNLGMQDLYNKLLSDSGENVYERILKTWVEENDYKTYLAGLQVGTVPDLAKEDIWELYALTRVLDMLTLRFQPDNKADGSDWPGLELSLAEYIAFNNLIGLNTEVPRSFNTFDCEIIEAREGEIDFHIDTYLFPIVRLKNLIIKRAGVNISLNPHNYNLTIINNTTIYWAHRRKNRKYEDLSHGWGHNSQWRTDLRLDIETYDSFIYNLNGKFDLNNVTPELSAELNTENLSIQEAIELVKFRHFIMSTKENGGLFPYNFKYKEPKIRK